MSTSVGLVEAMTTTIISQGTRKACAAFYFLFARLFREPPSEELLRLIVDDRLLTTEEIAVEYARLFAVPGEQAVHPYESVYCDTLAIDTSTACSPYFEPEAQGTGLSGFLHGSSAVAVREAYRRAGFELDAAVHELPDHLAIELEFMGRLLAQGDTRHATVFFAEHLGRWIFSCLDDVRQKAAGGFYRAAADALEAFVQHEHAVFATGDAPAHC